MFCPSCGTQIPEDSLFCLKCARSMSLAPNASIAVGAPVPKAKGVRRVGLIVVGLFVAVLAVVAGIWAAYYRHGRTMDQSAPATSALPPQASKTLPVSPPKPKAVPIKLSPGEISAKYSDAVVILR